MTRTLPPPPPAPAVAQRGNPRRAGDGMISPHVITASTTADAQHQAVAAVAEHKARGLHVYRARCERHAEGVQISLWFTEVEDADLDEARRHDAPMGSSFLCPARF